MNGITSSSQDIKYPPNVASNRGISADADNERLYETKHNKKVSRIFTVILYMFSVSLGAILLSLYYVFLWKNPHTRHYLQFKNEKLNGTTKIDPLAMELEQGPIVQMDQIKTKLEIEVATAFPKMDRGVPPIAAGQQRDIIYAELPQPITFKYTRGDPRNTVKTTLPPTTSAWSPISTFMFKENTKKKPEKESEKTDIDFDPKDPVYNHL